MLNFHRTFSMKSRILSLAFGSLLIAGNTPAADSKKGKVFTRLIKEITVAAKLGGATVSFALVGAVFLSNLPEAIGVAAALLAGGH